jgi:hypothetical protein
VLVAILSDTHLRTDGQLPPACLEVLWSADMIVHAGDFSEPVVLEELESIGPPVIAVHGNVDSPELVTRLPAELTVQLAGTALAVVHDAGPANGRLERLRLRFPDAAAVVFGHSHMPLHEVQPNPDFPAKENPGSFQIFNPGSPTQRRRAPKHTMGTANVKGRSIEFELVELD